MPIATPPTALVHAATGLQRRLGDDEEREARRATVLADMDNTKYGQPLPVFCIIRINIVLILIVYYVLTYPDLYMSRPLTVLAKATQVLCVLNIISYPQTSLVLSSTV